MNEDAKAHGELVSEQITDWTVDDWSVQIWSSNSTQVSQINSGDFPLKHIASLEKKLAQVKNSRLSDKIVTALNDVTELLDLTNGGLNYTVLELIRIQRSRSNHFFRISSNLKINDTPKITYARMESLLKVLCETANNATVIDNLATNADITPDFLEHVRIKLADKLTEDQTYNTANAAEKELVAKWWED